MMLLFVITRGSLAQERISLGILNCTFLYNMQLWLASQCPVCSIVIGCSVIMNMGVCIESVIT